MIDQKIPAPVLEIIHNYLGFSPEILSFEEKGGGSINSAASIRTASGNFFAKWNTLQGREGMFSEELYGLEKLGSAGEIRVPKGIGAAEKEGRCFLVMEHIDSGDFEIGFWEIFGRKMALLHKHSHNQFGFEHDNFIGSLPQKNTFSDSWVDFFIKYRLEPQLKIAVDSGKADSIVVKKFESLYTKLDDIFPKEKPSLLHGDLWGGNFMCTLDGNPAIFDPAVYYGNREMDLAMSRLFGGFDPEFYDAYQEEFPLEPGFEKRFDLCNLYPLLVHVNLFPGSYIQSVKHIVSRF
ncbi:MAG: fructosamine kinase family protein [Flavobacteriales bacterium]|nr:fructosamine kinase family protein [Flavobacteriales bacterium]